MLRYPLLDKFNPQCPQDIKCSLIKRCLRATIPSLDSRAPFFCSHPATGRASQEPPNPPFFIRATSILLAGPLLSRPQVSPAKPASPQRRLLAKGPELSVQKFTGPHDFACSPAIAALLLVAAAGGWISLGGRLAKPAQAAHLSIVVLPFANFSGDASQDYFADGITENLTTELSRVKDSFVIARNTAFTHEGQKAST